MQLGQKLDIHRNVPKAIGMIVDSISRQEIEYFKSALDRSQISDAQKEKMLPLFEYFFSKLGAKITEDDQIRSTHLDLNMQERLKEKIRKFLQMSYPDVIYATGGSSVTWEMLRKEEMGKLLPEKEPAKGDPKERYEENVNQFVEQIISDVRSGTISQVG